MKYLLGIDFGGGASKATLLDTEGHTVCTHTVEYQTAHPAPDRCEQLPDDWYEALCEDTRALLAKSGVSPRDILCVSLDAATHTAVLCDGDFRVLRPAIHWTDSRSRAECEQIHRDYPGVTEKLTYHSADTVWTLPQLMWVRAKEPDIFSQIRHIFFHKDYLRMRLTGVYATDMIDAEGSMLFDYRTLSWSPELCMIGGVDMAMLPPILQPTDPAGTVTHRAAADTGLAEGTPVIAGTTDTVLEVTASGAVSRGNMTVKLATAGRICIVTDRAYPHRHLINYSHIADGLWYPGTATKSCAASYRWFRDTFGGDYRELDRGAAAVPAGSEGLFFHPYLNGELTPYGDPLISGSFTGVRAGHTKQHFARAVMEGVAYSLCACLDVIREIGIPHDDEAVIIGGGAASPLWRQITADALGITLRTAKNSDSSLGAAMLAGIATGVFRDPADAVAHAVTFDTVTTPDESAHAVYAEARKTYTAIHDALAPVYHARAGL